MNEQRKKIILSEIKYWKQNNLIPDHYCDFLTALYAEGNHEKEEQGKSTSSILHKEKRKQRHLITLLLVIGVLIAITMAVMNNEVGIFVGGIGVTLLLAYATIKTAKKSVILPFIYIVSALLLLFMSLKVWMLFFVEQPMILIGLLLLNCVMWLFAGRKLNLLYFTLSGAIGLICIILFLVFQF